jgi:hypothetical protein
MRKIHVEYTYNGQGQESRFSMVGKKVGHLWKMKLKLIIFKAQANLVIMNQKHLKFPSSRKDKFLKFFVY